ncbi:MAG: methyltransferase domain-containing protein [Anaerolineales bacterium]|jgi:demethylmenaquinone methyltransferase/2-methoxy-6-polyprenyl-1,4-benzoquinol methylase
MPIFDHFDILAPLYDRLIRIPENDRLAQVVGLPVAGRLLDAAGGTGRIAQQLVDRAGLVVISDVSFNMLRQSRQKDGLCCAVGSETEKLAFADASFERVIVVDAYHHLLDQELSLREFWRVLAPGGRLVIEEPDIRRFGVKLLALAEKLALFRSHFVLAEKIAKKLAGFGARTRVIRDGATVWIVAEKELR